MKNNGYSNAMVYKNGEYYNRRGHRIYNPDAYMRAIRRNSSWHKR